MFARIPSRPCGIMQSPSRGPARVAPIASPHFPAMSAKPAMGARRLELRLKRLAGSLAETAEEADNRWRDRPFAGSVVRWELLPDASSSLIGNESDTETSCQ